MALLYPILRKLFCAIILTLQVLNINGQVTQKSSAIWYFGDEAGLDFNQSPPQALTDGQLDTQEGVATISDATGSLLFYTDGSTIWDKNHNPMPNGIGLQGHFSSTQSAIIVPFLNNPGLYYVFTLDELAGGNGLRYSVVDMKLNGNGNGTEPLGDVISNQKNVALASPTTEKITAILKPDNKTYWVITHLWNSNTFFAYEIDCNGLNPAPVVSQVGNIHGGGNMNINSVGYMTASLDGTTLALTNRNTGTVDIYDFNKVTGEVSNETIVPTRSTSLYGVEFSPSGEYLFIGGLSSIERYSIQSDELITIDIDNTSAVSGSNSIRALQIGPDMNIYVSVRNLDHISIIRNPESTDPFLETEAIFLNTDNNGRNCRFGLPNIFFFDVEIPDTIKLTACPNTSVEYQGVLYPSGTETPISVEGDEGCFNTLIVDVEESETTSAEIDVQVCQGDTYVINGIALEAGDEELVLIQNKEGCDSSILVSVSNYPLNARVVILESCAGTTVEFNGEFLEVNSEQTFVFEDQNGCDSLVSVIVNEVDIITEIINEDLCQGEVYVFNGEEFPIGTDTIFDFTDQNGCRNNTFIQIKLSEAVEYDLLADSICSNTLDGSITLADLSGSTAPYTFSINDSPFSDNPTFDSLSTGDYIYTIRDDNGCRYTREISIDEIPAFSVSFTEPILPCVADSIMVTVEVSPANTPNLSWSWANGSTSNATFISQPGVYGFKVENACQSVEDEITIESEELELEQLMYIPNAFSPNRDGINDCFSVFPAPEFKINSYEFHIYDRWGTEVFHTTDLGACWDGAFRDKAYNSGVFVWWLQIDGEVCRMPMNLSEKGNLTLFLGD